MSISSVMVYISSYLLRGFIRSISGTEGVGLFSAGFSILTVYVGMVFTAIGTDYYPRLAASCRDHIKCNEIVNQQGEIASLILGPLLMGCVVFMTLMIKILYSSSFLPATDYMYWAIIGMMFKLGSWLMAYQIIAKGDMKVFLINETVFNIYFFVMSIIGFKYWGITGLGVSFSIGYFLYFVQVFLVTARAYKFSFTRSSSSIFLFELIMVVLCMLVIKVFGGAVISYIVGSTVILLGCLISFFLLDKRIGLVETIKNKRIH